MTTHPDSNVSDEFFVGYLPTPPDLRRRLRITLIVLTVLILGLSALIAAQMRPTGTGTWDTDHVATITGVLHASPYAFIETHDADGSLHAVLLVEEGKHGARSSLKSLDGDAVAAKGALISRHGQSMLELAADTDPQQVATDQKALPVTLSTPTTPPAQPISLTGEIFDPKCFLGAMKPGAGKTHKGCAALCLRGGIPPMFASIDSQNRISAEYVLVDSQGRAFGDEDLKEIIDLVGEPVGLQGVAVMDHGLPTLRIDPKRIVRLESK